MYALETKNLSKTYKNGTRALKDVSLTVKEGDFFALLGPNGAGKSTLIGIITSLVNKSSGKVNILGVDIDKDFAKAKSFVGVVPQEFNFNVFRKVESILRTQAGYYGLPDSLAKKRVDKYLALTGLEDKRDNLAKSLSGGMKRRLMIARAMLHEPKLLILDEPTAGVDIEIRRTMWDFLRKINAEGTTIILTTHYLEEAENLCRNIAIINHGQVIENTSLPKLLHQLNQERFILYLEKPLLEIPKLENYDICSADECSLDVEVPADGNITDLIHELDEHNIKIKSMKNKANRLEELFIRLTSREAE